MFSDQGPVKVAREMKGWIDQTGGTVPSTFLSYIFETHSLPARRNKYHSAHLLLEGLLSMVLVDAGISRSGSGALLLAQVHTKYFLSPLPFKSSMTK